MVQDAVDALNRHNKHVTVDMLFRQYGHPEDLEQALQHLARCLTITETDGCWAAGTRLYNFLKMVQSLPAAPSSEVK